MSQETIHPATRGKYGTLRLGYENKPNWCKAEVCDYANYSPETIRRFQKPEIAAEHGFTRPFPPYQHLLPPVSKTWKDFKSGKTITALIARDKGTIDSEDVKAWLAENRR